MPSFLYRLVDRWVARRVKPDPQRRQSADGLAPAVVITGASRGIGRALAQRFAEADTHRVVLIARRTAPLEDAAREIHASVATRPVVVPLDITRPSAPLEIDTALRAHGLYLDYLVNCAGVGLAGPLHEQDPRAIEELIALNITALSRLMRHVLPSLRARGRGGILNVASLGGYLPGPHQAAYYASKAYVISLTEAVAEEVAGEGVRIAVVAPGPVDTGFHDAMHADGALYRKVLPLRSPHMVAHSAYRGLMLGRTVIVPGVLEQVTAVAARFLPRVVARWVTGILLKVRR